jgi:hypothetical protein
MWAQLITSHVKEGKVDDLTPAIAQLRTLEQPDSGLLHTIAMPDWHDQPARSCSTARKRPEPARATRDAKPAFKRYEPSLPRSSTEHPNSPT